VRIALLISQLTLGGAERQLVRTAAALAADGAGHEVFVLANHPGLGAVEAEAPPTLPNLRFDALAVSGRRAKVAATRHRLRSFAPDVVVGWLRASWVLGGVLHEIDRRPSLYLAERNALASYPPTWRRAKVLVARRADRIVANSEEAAGEWRSVSSRFDVRVAQNFPPPRRAVATRQGEGPRRLVVVGRLEQVKGIDVAVRALAEARGAGADLELVVVGRDDEHGAALQRYRDLALSLGVDAAIEWRPPSKTWLDDVAGTVDGVLIPSRSEGSSNVLAEALAAGVPVLATTGVHAPRAGMAYAQALAGDPTDLARLLVDEAWTASRVEPGAFDAWEREAADQAVAAWSR